MAKKKINGMLPSEKWLKENGYSGLVEVMKKHPEKFAHVPQNKNEEKAE